MSEPFVAPQSDDLERVLIDSANIERRVSQLARQVSADFAGVDQLMVVGVLKGAFIFLADLCRRLTVPHRVDFIALSSYGRGATASGVVRMVMDLKANIEGRQVLIVEDIVDSGYTLDYLVRNFSTRNPASLRSCVLLSKPERRQVDVDIDYLGFEIPNVWVVGYGLDYADTYRTLPFIAELKSAVYQKQIGAASLSE
jgi:hypoxanthine phosphoribosyltransferase